MNPLFYLPHLQFCVNSALTTRPASSWAQELCFSHPKFSLLPLEGIRCFPFCQCKVSLKLSVLVALRLSVTVRLQMLNWLEYSRTEQCWLYTLLNAFYWEPFKVASGKTSIIPHTLTHTQPLHPLSNPLWFGTAALIHPSLCSFWVSNIITCLLNSFLFCVSFFLWTRWRSNMMQIFLINPN